MFKRVAFCLTAAAPTLAQQIQELRYRTDAPILQCKKAIGECGGDLEKAIEWLRAKGAADSVKKQGRETAFGTLAVAIPREGSAVSELERPAAIIELGAETDFAVRNAKFALFATDLAADLSAVIGDAEHAQRAPDELLDILSKRTADKKAQLIASLGENITVKKVWSLPLPAAGLPPRYASSSTPNSFTVGKYVHNSTLEAPLVGNIVGIAGLWSYSAGGATVVSAEDADDFAQHLVSHLGDKSDVAAQTFLGSDQTVSQWCKQRVCRLRAGYVFKYGMEAPQLVEPKPVEAPKEHQQQRKP